MPSSLPTAEAVATENLLAKSADGSSEAWDALLNRVSPFLRTVLRGRIPGKLQGNLDTDEAFQEGFLALRKQAGNFSSQGPGSARKWMTAVIKNRLNDLVRYHGALRRAPRSESVEADLQADSRFDPANLISKLDEVAELLAKIEELPALRRELIARHFFEKQSFAQISAEMEVPVGTLRKWMAHSLVTIKQPRREES